MPRRWVKEHAEANKSTFSGYGSARDQELAALKQELKQVKFDKTYSCERCIYLTLFR